MAGFAAPQWQRAAIVLLGMADRHLYNTYDFTTVGGRVSCRSFLCSGHSEGVSCVLELEDGRLMSGSEDRTVNKEVGHSLQKLFGYSGSPLGCTVPGWRPCTASPRGESCLALMMERCVFGMPQHILACPCNPPRPCNICFQMAGFYALMKTLSLSRYGLWIRLNRNTCHQLSLERPSISTIV